MPVETKAVIINNATYTLIGSAKTMLTSRSIGAESFLVVVQEVGNAQPSSVTSDRITADDFFEYVGDVADFWALGEVDNFTLEVIRS